MCAFLIFGSELLFYGVASVVEGKSGEMVAGVVFRMEFPHIVRGGHAVKLVEALAGREEFWQVTGSASHLKEVQPQQIQRT